MSLNVEYKLMRIAGFAQANLETEKSYKYPLFNKN
jgi:hypothetical protein